MQITTKHNTGDIVYAYKNKEVPTLKITDIKVHVCKSHNPTIKYFAVHVGSTNAGWFDEKDLTEDKVELANRLLADLGLAPSLTKI
jgi:hypothetical protein